MHVLVMQFFFVFIGYSFIGYMLFGTSMYEYVSLTRAAQAQFEMMQGSQLDLFFLNFLVLVVLVSLPLPPASCFHLPLPCFIVVLPVGRLQYD